MSKEQNILKINIGDIMLHDGYPIDKDNELVKVRIDGFIEDTNLIKCSFFDEYFTNHVTTKDELYQKK
tara:strand:- start:52 stop:255 length:204 start_codon:yes stop_codon:yes gene_type:complete